MSQIKESCFGTHRSTQPWRAAVPPLPAGKEKNTRRFVYQLYEDGVMVFEGTAKEVSSKMGISSKSLYNYVKRGYRINGKYAVGMNGKPPLARAMPDRSHKARKKKQLVNTGRRGSPGHPVPFEKMSPLSQDVYLARQVGMSYGQYKGQTYKPMCKTDRIKDALMECAQDTEEER